MWSSRLTKSNQLVGRHRISGAGIIRGLGFAKSGRYLKTNHRSILFADDDCRRLITNSSDRILRQFNLPTYPPPPSSHQATPAHTNVDPPGDAITDADVANHASPNFEIVEHELEPVYRFSDPITKVAWHNMAYSPDGEWLAGGRLRFPDGLVHL